MDYQLDLRCVPCVCLATFGIMLIRVNVLYFLSYHQLHKNLWQRLLFNCLIYPWVASNGGFEVQSIVL